MGGVTVRDVDVSSASCCFCACFFLFWFLFSIRGFVVAGSSLLCSPSVVFVGENIRDMGILEVVWGIREFDDSSCPMSTRLRRIVEESIGIDLPEGLEGA